MKKQIIIFIVFTIFGTNIIKAQDQFSKRRLIVKAFISAVFKERQMPRLVMDNYMHVPSNDAIPQENKERLIAGMIDTLVKENSKLLPSSDYEVFKYNEFKGAKKTFNTDDPKDILILVVNNKAAIYFYFKEERIMSFYFIEKGPLSFFVTI